MEMLEAFINIKITEQHKYNQKYRLCINIFTSRNNK